jgi:hypothetical protein
MEGVQMTPEQQRIAIAEACGWNYIDSKTIYPRGIKDGVTLELPDYLNDLNAMHDAEKGWFDRHDLAALDTYDEYLHEATSGWKWNATASERAEAFLRTIGKWKECK